MGPLSTPILISLNENEYPNPFKNNYLRTSLATHHRNPESFLSLLAPDLVTYLLHPMTHFTNNEIIEKFSARFVNSKLPQAKITAIFTFWKKEIKENWNKTNHEIQIPDSTLMVNEIDQELFKNITEFFCLVFDVEASLSKITLTFRDSLAFRFGINASSITLLRFKWHINNNFLDPTREKVRNVQNLYVKSILLEEKAKPNSCLSLLPLDIVNNILNPMCNTGLEKTLQLFSPEVEEYVKFLRVKMEVELVRLQDYSHLSSEAFDEILKSATLARIKKNCLKWLLKLKEVAAKEKTVLLIYEPRLGNETLQSIKNRNGSMDSQFVNLMAKIFYTTYDIECRVTLNSSYIEYLSFANDVTFTWKANNPYLAPPTFLFG